MTTHRELAARLIRDGEGLRLKVYDDASGKPVTAGSVLAGHPSIGYGRNLAGKGISESEADAMLAEDLVDAEEIARGFIGGQVWLALGDARRAGFQQPLGLFRVGREMEIGVKDLPFAKLDIFRRLGLFHFNDHVVFGENGFGVRRNRCARRPIVVVAGVDADAAIRFDHHLVSMRDIFTDRSRCHSDPEFIVLDFFWHADAHGIAPSSEFALI